MKSIFTLCTALFLLFSTISFAQQASENRLTKTIYYYSFNTESSASSTDKIEREVKLLKGVTEVKVKFKPENKTGQLIVIVQEKPRSSEGDILFQPTDLKRILSTNGFIPNELETKTMAD
jgi:copper chaperone CopZ